MDNLTDYDALVSVQSELDKLKKDYNDLTLANLKLIKLLKDCKRQFEEVELCRYDVADIDQEDWFKISTEQASIANKMITKIDKEIKND